MFAGKMLAVPACQATCHHEGSAGRTLVVRRNGTWTNYDDDYDDDDDGGGDDDDGDDDDVDDDDDER